MKPYIFSWQDSLRSCSATDSSSANNTRRRSRSSFSNQSRDVRESSFDENEEYAYAENQRSMSYKVKLITLSKRIYLVVHISGRGII